MSRKARSRPVAHASRIHITCHLPVNDERQVDAAMLIFEYLRNRDIDTNFTGFCHSQMIPCVFRGFWFSTENECFVSDKLVLVMIDYPNSPESNVAAAAVRLKKAIADSYAECTGRAEDEIWITAEEVVQFAT